MKITTALVFLCAIAAAIAVAAWQYSRAPQGILLYTPMPGSSPNYTSASLVGFLAGAGGLATLSGLVAMLGFLGGWLGNRRLLGPAKQAALLAVGLAAACVLGAGSERLWP